MECLRRISEGPTVLEVCRADIIARLVQLGLISNTPGLHYPIACAQAAFKLTDEGWRMFRERAH